MPTFKAVVQRHQERKDGKFPISIRVIHNRQVCYLSTGLYCSRSQINKHTFEIKDQFILTRTGQTIRNYESALLEIDTEAMRSMSVHELCTFFRTNAQELDFIRYSQAIVESNPRRYGVLHSALRIIHTEHGHRQTIGGGFYFVVPSAVSGSIGASRQQWHIYSPIEREYKSTIPTISMYGFSANAERIQHRVPQSDCA